MPTSCVQHCSLLPAVSSPHRATISCLPALWRDSAPFPAIRPSVIAIARFAADHPYRSSSTLPGQSGPLSLSAVALVTARSHEITFHCYRRDVHALHFTIIYILFVTVRIRKHVLHSSLRSHCCLYYVSYCIHSASIQQSCDIERHFPRSILQHFLMNEFDRVGR